MELTLRPGKPSDVPSFVETFFDGFSTHPPTQHIFLAGTAPATNFWLNSMIDEVKDPKARFLVVEDTSTTPPTFAGFAKWNRLPATEKPADPLDDNWPENGDQELARRFFGLLHEKHEEIIGGREHWFLELIATKKGYQRKGVGAKLVGWGVERADEEGWDAYLDSTPEGRRLYEKFGFRTLETRDFPEIGYLGHAFMVREKRG